MGVPEPPELELEPDPLLELEPELELEELEELELLELLELDVVPPPELELELELELEELEPAPELEEPEVEPELDAPELELLPELEPEPPLELPPQAANSATASMLPACNRIFMVSSKSWKAVPGLMPGDVQTLASGWVNRSQEIQPNGSDEAAPCRHGSSPGNAQPYPGTQSDEKPPGSATRFPGYGLVTVWIALRTAPGAAAACSGRAARSGG